MTPSNCTSRITHTRISRLITTQCNPLLPLVGGTILWILANVFFPRFIHFGQRQHYPRPAPTCNVQAPPRRSLERLLRHESMGPTQLLPRNWIRIRVGLDGARRNQSSVCHGPSRSVRQSRRDARIQLWSDRP